MILIRDAKMPACCSDCPLIDFGPGCKIIGEVDTDVTEERAKNCPLIGVVTCKDCKYNCENVCDIDDAGVEDDYFCGSAERR